MVINRPFIYIFHCPHALLMAWVFVTRLVAMFLVSQLCSFSFSYFLESTNFVVCVMLRWPESIVGWFQFNIAELRGLFLFWDQVTSVPHLCVHRYVRLCLMRLLPTCMLALLVNVLVNTTLGIVHPWISFLLWVPYPVDQRLGYWWYVKAVGTIGKLSLEIEINGTFHIYSIFNLIIVSMNRAILCINWILIIL